MGLIKLLTGSVGSTFRDAAKDYYRCDGMTNDVLVMPATQVLRNGSCNNATNRVISDGSVFDVAAGQAALLIENGKVYDFVLATEDTFAGQYKYDSKVEPSFLATSSIKEALKVGIETAKQRFTFGSQSSNTMNIIYINLKEITKNPVGFGKTAFKDKYLKTRLMLSGHGYYTFKIQDPMAFYENMVMDYNKKYMKSEITEQMRVELQPVLQEAIGLMAPQCEGGYDDIYTKRREIAQIVNESLKESWGDRGIVLDEIAITPQLSPEDEKRVMELENNKTLSNADMALGSMINAQNNAMQTAAGNTGGAAMGFYGMNMAQQMGGFNANQMLMQQMQMQQAQQMTQPTPVPAANSWTCSCGTTNTGAFCQGCGTKKPAPTPTADSWTCKCGTTNTGRFCQGCGSPKEEKKVCSKCGNEIPKSDVEVRFCPNCGNKLD